MEHRPRRTRKRGHKNRSSLTLAKIQRLLMEGEKLAQKAERRLGWELPVRVPFGIRFQG